MALNNTAERYKYIYGNTVRKYNMEDTSPKKEKQPVPKKKPSHATAKLIDTIDRKLMAVSVLAIAMVMMMTFFYVHENAKANSMGAQIRSLTEEKADLQSKQSSIQSEIDKSINLDDIREYAEKNLDMVSPDYDDYIYYDQENSDYFRQYESIDK